MCKDFCYLFIHKKQVCYIILYSAELCNSLSAEPFEPLNYRLHWTTRFKERAWIQLPRCVYKHIGFINLSNTHHEFGFGFRLISFIFIAFYLW